MKSRRIPMARNPSLVWFAALLALSCACARPCPAPIPVPSQGSSSGLVAHQPPSDAYMSPTDKAIREDRPPHPWSKNVPNRSCIKDDECGDGFCDRGRCSAIWTAAGIHGQRCKIHEHCATYLCIEGRCRSCVSDAECMDEPDNQNPKCISEPFVPGSRACVGVAGSGEGDAVPGFPPPSGQP